MSFPIIINGGVMGISTQTCIVCGFLADGFNVLGSFCSAHKHILVREFLLEEDLVVLDIIPDQELREHIKNYIRKTSIDDSNAEWWCKASNKGNREFRKQHPELFK
jgi:hypothetical protein